MGIPLQPREAIEKKAPAAPESTASDNANSKEEGIFSSDERVQTPEGDSGDAQAGVLAIRATTAVWSRQHLIAAHVL